MTCSMSKDEQIAPERLEKYFSVTRKALQKAGEAPVNDERAAEVLDMAKRYFSDAEHFAKKGEDVLAFAALNYAHGWLDCGASLKLYHVTDNDLFTVDED
jgi:uncharacterized protein